MKKLFMFLSVIACSLAVQANQVEKQIQFNMEMESEGEFKAYWVTIDNPMQPSSFQVTFNDEKNQGKAVITFFTGISAVFDTRLAQARSPREGQVMFSLNKEQTLTFMAKQSVNQSAEGIIILNPLSCVMTSGTIIVDRFCQPLPIVRCTAKISAEAEE